MQGELNRAATTRVVTHDGERASCCVIQGHGLPRVPIYSLNSHAPDQLVAPGSRLQWFVDLAARAAAILPRTDFRRLS
jgi:hypothetical protein